MKSNITLQSRLLRFLETGELRRVVATSIRVVAATNRAPSELEAGAASVRTSTINWKDVALSEEALEALRTHRGLPGARHSQALMAYILVAKPILFQLSSPNQRVSLSPRGYSAACSIAPAA
jgi:hypothetical protein